MFGFSALVLLANPEQWRALAGNPALVSNAVVETLRASRRANSVLVRYARTDLEIDGVTIETGDLVLLSNAAANHDPSVFTRPDQVDISWSTPKHLAFGHGTRHCIGAPLARIELYAVLSQLASRFPTMRLAVGVEELTLRTDMLFGGLTELPVRLVIGISADHQVSCGATSLMAEAMDRNDIVAGHQKHVWSRP
jgi:pentalenolactone synthase